MLRRKKYFEYIHVYIRVHSNILEYIHIPQHLFQMPHFPDLSINPFNQIYSLCFKPHRPALSPRLLSYSALGALKATPHK